MRTLRGGNSDGYYYWKHRDFESRIKWLNKHIKKNS